MRARWGKIALSTAALAALAVPPALAGSTAGTAVTAGSLVFVKSGRVYVSRTDGSQARPVTPATTGPGLRRPTAA